MRDSKSDAPICSVDFVMPFGKYCGKTLGEIAEYDGQYILWLHNERILRIDKRFRKDVEMNERELRNIVYEHYFDVYDY